MSRPDRPYRATIDRGDVTLHHDYATKEQRNRLWAQTSASRTTVTSRKPVKPGTPVCWVNVYSAGQPVNCSMYYNKEVADGIIYPKRLHCIPVYLPGEGEPESAWDQEARLRGMLHTLDGERKDLRSEVERLTNLAKDCETTARVWADERDTARAEVARLTAELASLHLGCEEFKRQRDEARNGPTAQALAQAFANGQREALADVRVALGIKEES